MANPLRTTAQQRRAAKALVRDGKSPQQALRAAGYSKSTAQRGAHQIFDSIGLKMAVLQEMARGKKIPLPSPEEQADFVRWKLLINAAQGKDAAVQSLKLLGSDRRVNMWTADVQHGVVVLQVPASFNSDALNLPRLEDQPLEPPNPK